MAMLTLRLADAQHARLKVLTRRRGMSLDRLIEEVVAQALAEFDVETRFRRSAARGLAGRGLALLDKLDAEADGA